MSDIAIHELPIAATLTGAETIPIDDGAATVRTTVAAVRSGLALQTHDHALADVTGLQTALGAKAPLATPSLTGPVTVTGPYTTVTAFDPWRHAGLIAAEIGAEAGSGGSVVFAAASGLWRFAAIRGYAVDGGNNTRGCIDFLIRPDNTVPALSVGGRMDHTGSWCFGGSASGASLIVTAIASATRGLTIQGSASGDPRVGATGGARVDFSAIPALPSYTIATLPVATARGLVFVTDGSNGRRLAVADGSRWCWPDGATVS